MSGPLPARSGTRRGRKVALGLGIAAGGVLAAMWRPDISYTALEARYGAASRYILTPDGVRLHYRDVGRAEGPVLVLLHGYTASSLDWAAWVALLQSRYRLILVDLPGHGLTAAPAGYGVTAASLVATVATLADVLRLPRFVLVGSSMGGQVAWRYALDHPSRLAGMVLVAATGWSGDREATASSSMFRMLGSALGRFMLRHADLTILVRRSLRQALGDDRLVTPDLVQRTTDLSRAPGHRAILTALRLPGGDAPQLARLAGLTVPTLVMAGEADRLVPMAQAERFAAAIAGASLILYPGVGHVPMQQWPERSATDLDAWLRRTASWT